MRPSGAVVNRLKGHVVRLKLDAEHLGGTGGATPLESPPALDAAHVAEMISSSTRWVDVIRELDLAETTHSYKRLQAIARDAGVTLLRTEHPVICDYRPPAAPPAAALTVSKGTRSEAAIMNALIAAGYNVLIPFGVARYDLVIETAEGFKRVQCKTAHPKSGGAMTFSVCSSSPERARRPYSGEIDFFGVYLPEFDRVYLIPIAEVDGQRKDATFRLRDAAEDPGGAHYAAPYRLVAQVDRALVS
jgi:hypothetical protein